MAGAKGNTYVLALIPIIKAKLLGLDKGRLDDIDGEKPLFNIVDVMPEIAKGNEAVSQKAVDDCIKILKSTQSKKVKKES